jgi:hypothetical protein
MEFALGNRLTVQRVSQSQYLQFSAQNLCVYIRSDKSSRRVLETVHSSRKTKQKKSIRNEVSRALFNEITDVSAGRAVFIFSLALCLHLKNRWE